MNNFKKKALGVVARSLPVEELDKYVQMFRLMDKDQNGNLSLEELMDGLHINGQAVPESEIRMLSLLFVIFQRNRLQYCTFYLTCTVIYEHI